MNIRNESKSETEPIHEKSETKHTRNIQRTPPSKQAANAYILYKIETLTS